MSDLLNNLTPNQQKAVTYKKGPLMIVAGAGTGKTTVLTRRIAWLVEQGVKPENILALTFTEKAATEMETRVDELLDYGQIGAFISTFHGFGQHILQQFPLISHISDKTHVLTETENQLFMAEHIMDFPLQSLRPLSNPTANIRAIRQFWSKCKDELISSERLTGHLKEVPKEDYKMYRELADGYAFYQELLQKHNFLDYGDLLFKSYFLLKDDTQALSAIQSQFTYVLVDEYQDTNVAQTALLKLITSNGNVTIVGDDDQSIYRFRGASVGQMEAFRNAFKPTIITLNDNFRSPQFVLDASHELIQKNNPYRLEASAGISKKLIAARQSEKAAEIPLYQFTSDQKEAEWIVQDIQNRITRGDSIGDHAILVRTNNQARAIQHELEIQGVPYTTESKSLLSQDSTVKLLINYLQAVTNPRDSLAMFFLATSPIYKVEGSDLVPLLAEARSKHKSLESELQNLKNRPNVTQLLDDLTQARDLLPHKSAAEVLLAWVEHHNSLQQLTANDPAQDVKIAQALTHFFDIIRQFERTTGNKSVFHFLETLPVLLADYDEWGEDTAPFGQDVVKLYTIHMAKGLEFPVVYITNVTSDRFPLVERNNAIELPPGLGHAEPEGEHLREERRLMYVAMTRAQNELILTRAEKYGSGSRTRKPSIFLSEFSSVPAGLSEKSDSLPKTLHSQLSTPNLSLHLTPHQIEDYLTCPLRYRYAHIDKLPTPNSQNVMVGTAVHACIEHYFGMHLQGKKPTLKELMKLLEGNWRAEGFISEQHEQARMVETKTQIKRFFDQFEQLPTPHAIEMPIDLGLDGVSIHGRIDAVFTTPFPDAREASTYILDFKTSDTVTTLEKAERRAKESLQLTLYTLGYQNKEGIIPAVGLYFPSSGLFGWSTRSERQLRNVVEKIEKVVQGIQSRDFSPEPSQFNCSMCPFKDICPASVA